MAILLATNPTIVDWAKAHDPQGKAAIIAELLSQTNDVLKDAVFKRGNLPHGVQETVRTGLPTVYWRSINQGTPPSTDQLAQVTEDCAFLEARSAVDIKLIETSDDPEAYRFMRARAYLEAMNQQIARTIFYGRGVGLTTPPTFDKREPLGLSGRYPSLNLAASGNASNVLSCSGVTVGSNTSVWLIVWGEETIYLPFPMGSKTAGLQHRDLGEQMVTTSTPAVATEGTFVSEQMQAMVDLYSIDFGLMVKDWRFGVRVCNINTAEILTQTGTQAPTAASHILKMMSRATNCVHNLHMGRAAFYLNRTIFSGLQIAALEKSNAALAIQPALGQFGKGPDMYLSFMTVALRQSDSLVNGEAVVV